MKSRPNILIVMTDQQQAHASRREGFALDTSPFLDEMAAQGTWFDRGYTSCPVCVPARTSMLTGRYISAHGVYTNGLTAGLRRGEDLFDVAEGMSYARGFFGKNHTYLGPGRTDSWFSLGHAGARVGSYDLGGDRAPIPDCTKQERDIDQWLQDLAHGVSEKPTPFPLECQGPYRAVNAALKWVESLSRPFLMWLSFAEPHSPYQAPEPYFSLFPPDKLPPVMALKEAVEDKGFKWQFISRLGRRALERYDELLPRMRSNYYGMIRLIDDQVRRLMNGLSSLGLLQNTIVFFLSDHGDFAGEYGLMRKGPEMPEVLMRIPFYAAGPGIQQRAEAHTAHVSIVDVLPTVCEAIGYPIPGGVQGRSLWPLLTGQDYPEGEFSSAYAEQGFGGLDYGWDDNPDFESCIFPDGCIFSELNRYVQCGVMRMVRKGRWKLICDLQGRGQLYDLDEDPAELANLFDKLSYRDIRHELTEELLIRTLRAQDPLPAPEGRKSHPHNYWSA
jgi:arylsulfatase A-like enzyme